MASIPERFNMTQTEDLVDMVAETWQYYDLKSANQHVDATNFWHGVMTEFVEIRGYTLADFEELSWEADATIMHIKKEVGSIRV